MYACLAFFFYVATKEGSHVLIAQFLQFFPSIYGK